MNESVYLFLANDVYSLITMTATNIILLFTCLLLIKGIRNTLYIPHITWLMSIVFVIEHVIIANEFSKALFTNDIGPKLLILWLIVILIINYYIYVQTNIVYEERNENQLIVQNMQNTKKRYIEINEILEELYKVKHDLKHVLLLAKETKIDNKILDEYMNRIDSSEIINTGIVGIDVVLNRKLKICKKQNIDCKLLVNIEKSNVTDADFALILGNLIDNAIENISNTKKMINIKINQNLEYIVIHIENSIDKDINVKNNSLLTSKSNKKQHGYGIKTVQNICKKYDGNLIISHDESTFKADVLLKVSVRP